MGLGDFLGNYYGGLKPVPRLEVNESGIMFFTQGQTLERFDSLQEAMKKHPDFSGNVNFESPLKETLTGTLEIGRDMLFNLNGYSMTLESQENAILSVENGAAVRFEDGDVNLRNVQLNIDGNAVLENARIGSNRDFAVAGNLTVGKGAEVVFDQKDAFGINVHGSLFVERTSVIESNGSCIRARQGSSVTLDGGKVCGDTGIIVANDGSVNSLKIPVGSDVVVMGRGFGRFDPRSSTNDPRHLGNALAVVSESTELSVVVDVYAGRFVSL